MQMPQSITKISDIGMCCCCPCAKRRLNMQFPPAPHQLEIFEVWVRKSERG